MDYTDSKKDRHSDIDRPSEEMLFDKYENTHVNDRDDDTAPSTSPSALEYSQDIEEDPFPWTEWKFNKIKKDLHQSMEFLGSRII